MIKFAIWHGDREQPEIVDGLSFAISRPEGGLTIRIHQGNKKYRVIENAVMFTEIYQDPFKKK